MKVRLRKFPEITGTSDKFNTSSTNEVVVLFDTPGMGADSMFISDLEVLINDRWMPLNEAFKNNDLITDNYNTEFFPPMNEEERKRGYRLTEREIAELEAQSFD